MKKLKLPTKPKPKQVVAVRLSQEMISFIDRLAKQEGLTRTKVLEALVYERMTSN